MATDAQIQTALDRLEIQNLLVRYCTAIDSKDYDLLDTVFTEGAVIDYTSAGGIRGSLPEIKKWLAEALSAFPVTQHVVGNFEITIRQDVATSRCTFFNPMGLSLPRDNQELRMLFFGGYYNDKLVRTGEGWRIEERIEESVWQFGDLPQGFEIPQ